MSSPVPQSLNEMHLYLGADNHIWAIDTSSGRGYKMALMSDTHGDPGTGGVSEAPADGQLYGRKNSAWVPEHNIGRIMYDAPAVITGTETAGSRIVATIPASVLPPRPFNFIIDNFYLYNTVNPSPGSTGTWGFALLADLEDGSGAIWRTVTNSQDLSAAGIAFAAGALHKYLSLSPVAPNSGLCYSGGGTIQFALVCGTAPTKPDSSLRMGVALRPLSY